MKCERLGRQSEIGNADKQTCEIIKFNSQVTSPVEDLKEEN
jgi:hypothetical protein